MAFSYSEVTASTGQTTVTLTFPFLNRAHVTVAIDKVDLPASAWMWNSDSQIELIEPMIGGEAIKAYRTTPATGVQAEFQPGAFDYSELNISLRHLLYIVQEAYDNSAVAVEAGNNAFEYLVQIESLVADGAVMLADMQSIYSALLNLISRRFDTVASLLADIRMDYSSGLVPVAVGHRVEAGGYRYVVAGPTWTDTHITTQGGVRLYIDEAYGEIPLAAFGVGLGGDDAPQLLKALIWANGKRINAVGVSIKINSTLTFDGPVNVVSDPRSPWDLSGGGQVLFGREPQALSNRNTSILAGRSAISFVGGHGLAPHDIVVTHNPTAKSLSQFRDNYQDGCMFEVDTITSSTAITFYGVAPTTFPVAGFNMWKLLGQGVVLEGVRFIPSPASSPNVHIFGHKSVSLRKVSMDRGSSYANIEVWRCYEVHLDEGYGDATNGDAYPFVISNCQKVRARGLYSTSARHCIAWGGRLGPCSVPVRDVIISDSILFNRAAFGVGSGESHGNCIDLTYENCIMQTGANMAGENIALRGCVIYGRDVDVFADGTCIYGSEVRKGVFSIADCRLVTWGNGSSVGTINFDVSKREGDLTIKITNLTLENKYGLSTIRALMLNTEATGVENPYRIDVEVDGLTVPDNRPLFAVLSVTGTRDISSLLSVSIAGLKAAPGTAFMVATNPANFAAPMRLQKQSGASVVATSAGSNISISPPITLRYPYPRIPMAMVGYSSETGTGKDTFGGQRITSASMWALSPTSVRPEAHAAANFTSVENIRLAWEVGIADF